MVWGVWWMVLPSLEWRNRHRLGYERCVYALEIGFTPWLPFAWLYTTASFYFHRQFTEQIASIPSPPSLYRNSWGILAFTGKKLPAVQFITALLAPSSFEMSGNTWAESTTEIALSCVTWSSQRKRAKIGRYLIDFFTTSGFLHPVFSVLFLFHVKNIINRIWCSFKLHLDSVCFQFSSLFKFSARDAMCCKLAVKTGNHSHSPLLSFHSIVGIGNRTNLSIHLLPFVCIKHIYTNHRVYN